MTKPLVVVGDTLLDRDLSGRVTRLCPDAPVPVVDDLSQLSRPGGAGLAALLARQDGCTVLLITALAPDAAGDELRNLLAGAGISVVDLGLSGRTPEKVRVRCDGRSLLRLDHGSAPGAVGSLPAAGVNALASASAVLVADYGRGVAAVPSVRAALSGVRAPVVWDPHPRGPAPIAGCRVVTPNTAEAAQFYDSLPGSSTSGSDDSPANAGAAGPAADAGPQLLQGNPHRHMPSASNGLKVQTVHARALRTAWGASTVAITMGSSGALLVGSDGSPLVVPARQVPCFDPCGAGDRFSSAVARALASGALPSEAVAIAVEAATAFVAGGGAAAVRVTAGGDRNSPAEGSRTDVVGAVRARGGTVVATGGCFDLLHAGHVALLQQARSLGDCLVVLLNSDDSVRRRKGAGRPLVPAGDRETVLRALDCVDDVVVFDEDTPVAALETLRPDVWVKGGDYTLTDLPEATVVERWGGQAVILPYVDGKSTTAIVKEAARRGV